MPNNSNLNKAKKAKNDEFYTQLSDIENELKHYKKHFKNKIVYCNCDDPTWSNFFKYFYSNMKSLGIKRLITTHYNMDGSPSYRLDVVINELEEPISYITNLKGNGDFRSDECIKILKEADIVVSNPPFSLFSSYIAQLEEYNKKYIIWGNNNAITYKEIFPLLKNNKMWLGYTANKTQIFEVAMDYKYDEAETKKKNNGKHYGKVPAISVFTNLDIAKQHEKLDFYKKYEGHEDEFPKYDNYDAININKVSDIPEDYFGVMGVPVTFIDKFNPEQFEILGLLQSSTDEQAGIPNLRYYNNFKEMRQDMTFTGSSGGKANGNPVIQGKSAKGNFLYNKETNEFVHSIYARIVIQRKKETDYGKDKSICI